MTNVHPDDRMEGVDQRLSLNSQSQVSNYMQKYDLDDFGTSDRKYINALSWCKGFTYI